MIYTLIMIALPVGAYLALDTEPHLAPVRNLSYYLIVIPAFGMAAWVLAYYHQVRGMIASLSLSWIAFTMISLYVILPRLETLNPVNEALRHIPANTEVVSYKRFNPAFVFYLRRPIPEFSSADSLQQYLMRHPAWIITRERYAPELDSIQPTPPVVFRQRELFEPVTIELRRSAEPDAPSTTPILPSARH